MEMLQRTMRRGGRALSLVPGVGDGDVATGHDPVAEALGLGGSDDADAAADQASIDGLAPSVTVAMDRTVALLGRVDPALLDQLRMLFPDLRPWLQPGVAAPPLRRPQFLRIAAEFTLLTFDLTALTVRRTFAKQMRGAGPIVRRVRITSHMIALLASSGVIAGAAADHRTVLLVSASVMLIALLWSSIEDVWASIITQQESARQRLRRVTVLRHEAEVVARKLRLFSRIGHVSIMAALLNEANAISGELLDALPPPADPAAPPTRMQRLRLWWRRSQYRLAALVARLRGRPPLGRRPR